MRVIAAIVCSLAVSACGCSPEEAMPTPPVANGQSDDQAPPPYDGPELTAKLEPAAGQRRTLVVDVHCPTGGYALSVASVDEDRAPREVRLILTAPASDELVIQAFQHHIERIAIAADPTPVRVLVSQRRRRDPDAARQPFQLAATVTPQ